MLKKSKLTYWVFTVLTLGWLSGCSDNQQNFETYENPVYIKKSQNLGTVDFGTILYNQSKIITLNILNDGEDSLTGPPVILNHFQIIWQRNCQNVQPNQTCIVKLSFSGSGKSGLYQEVLSLGNLNIDILSQVTPPSTDKTVVLSQSAIDFGVVELNKTIIKTLVITNTSQIPLTEAISGANSFNKIYDSCSNKTIPPTKRCIVKIAFSGLQQSGLIQENLLYGNVASVSLTANVLQNSQAELKWTDLEGNNLLAPPEIFTLGSVPEQGSLFKRIKIKNDGRVQMSSTSSASITGSMNIVSNSCSNIALKPQQECQIMISFLASNLPVGVHSATVDYGGESRIISAAISPPAGLFPLNCTLARLQGRSNLENNQGSGNYMIDPDDGGPIEPFSVYCLHVSPDETLTEVFDLNREPNLTNEEILAKMNKFSTTNLSLSNLSRDNLRDGVQGVAWHSSANNLGLSYGLDKMNISGLKLSARRNISDPTGNQGALTLHNQNQTGCDHNWSSPSGCFNLAYKNVANQQILGFYDSSFGSGSTWYYNNNGTTTTINNSNTLNNLIVSETPQKVYLTSYGRLEGTFDSPPVKFYFVNLFFKDFNYILPVSCSDAKNRGALNSLGGLGSGVYLLDFDGNIGYEPSEVFCNMSGSGMATITRSCNEAKVYGQKSLADNFLSGIYQIDIDGLENGDPSTGMYCDMVSHLWDNKNGGFTLVGVFNTNDGLIVTPSNSVNLNDSNIYLNNTKYSELISRSQEIVFRSNRLDNTEVVMKTATSLLINANCQPNLNTIAPSYVAGGSYPMWGWVWGEPNCNASDADYSFIGMRSDGFSTSYFSYGFYNLLMNIWRGPTNTYSTSLGFENFVRSSNEKLYIFVR